MPSSGQKRVGITMSARQLSAPTLARTVETSVATIAIAPVTTRGTAGSSVVKMTEVNGTEGDACTAGPDPSRLPRTVVATAMTVGQGRPPAIANADRHLVDATIAVTARLNAAGTADRLQAHVPGRQETSAEMTRTIDSRTDAPTRPEVAEWRRCAPLTRCEKTLKCSNSSSSSPT